MKKQQTREDDNHLEKEKGNNQISVIFKLFLSMLKIGLFTFGGGYAMIPLIENEFVEKKKYMTHDEFMDMLAISESTPGPISVNSSTYIGYKVAGFWGSLLCTLGLVMPSFIIIFSLSLFLDKFLDNEWVSVIFKGIQVSVIFLITSAGIKMFKKMKKNTFNIIITIFTIISSILISIFSVSFSSIYFILISAFAGLIVYLISNTKTKVDKGDEK